MVSFMKLKHKVKKSTVTENLYTLCRRMIFAYCLTNFEWIFFTGQFLGKTIRLLLTSLSSTEIALLVIWLPSSITSLNSGLWYKKFLWSSILYRVSEIMSPEQNEPFDTNWGYCSHCQQYWHCGIANLIKNALYTNLFSFVSPNPNGEMCTTHNELIWN